MSDSDLRDDLEELVSAEDFLDYFEIPYDQRVVQVNRLHILQRFHNYLSASRMPEGEAAQRAHYIQYLSRAYQDFVDSDARTEKVLKIYQSASGESRMSISEAFGRG